jgi:DEAD/DEAH box helicase domain-containing protein
LWQLFSDLTYQSQRGRTLERIGKVTMSVPWERVQEVAALLLPRLREQFGAQGLDLPVLSQWLWGTLAHMRRRGGVMHPEMATYAGDGKVWQLAKGAGGVANGCPRWATTRPPGLPDTGQASLRFDKLSGNSRPTWYDRWAAGRAGPADAVGQGHGSGLVPPPRSKHC